VVGEYGFKGTHADGRRIKGREAEHFRLVNKALPPEELEGYLSGVD